MKRKSVGLLAGVLAAILAATVPAGRAQEKASNNGKDVAEARKLYKQIADARKLLEVELETDRATAVTAASAVNGGKTDARTTPASYRLWFDDAADGENMQMTLRHDARKWTAAYAVVPAWAQSTMQEWRGYHHGNGAGCVWRFGVTHDVDATKLTARKSKLAGTAPVTFLLDRTHDQRFPPGQAVSWWDRFPGVGLSTPRRQTFTLDAEIRDDAHVLELVLDGGIHWLPKKLKKRNKPAIRKPIFIRLSLPATRLSPIWVQTPTWNGGFHEGNASGLTLEDGKLSGELVVHIHTDGWVPVRGSRPPQKLVFRIDASLKHNRLDGDYTATGDMGDYSGTLTGRGGSAVVGSYNATGELDNATGLFHGYVIDDPAPLERHVLNIPKLPADDDAAMEQIARTLNTVTHEIRALQLAKQKFPLPLEEAMLQTACAAPVLDEANADALLRCLRRTAAMARNYGDARPQGGETLTSADRPESPSAGTVELPADENGICALPARPADTWYRLGQWHAAGPFGQREGVEHNDALVPDVVFVEGVKLRQRLDRVGAEIENAPTIEWVTVTPPSSRVRQPWGKVPFYNRFRGEVWYAAATVSSPSSRNAWLALEGLEQTKVWLNDRLVWSNEETSYRCRRRGRELVRVKLAKGNNHLLVRTNRDRRLSWVDLAIRLDKPETQPQPEPANLPAIPNPDIYPDADPPLAWDVDKGTNVAWSTPALRGRSRPTVVGEMLFVSRAPSHLYRVDIKTGKGAWLADFGDDNEQRREILALETHEDREAALLAEANRRAEKLGLKKFKGLRSIDVTSPVSDGKTLYVHNELGRLGAFELSGKKRWTKHTGLSKAEVHCVDGQVIVEGQTTTAWELPEKFRKLAAAKPKNRFNAIGVLVLDADDGKVLHRHTSPGEFSGKASFLLTAADGEGSSVVLHLSNGMLYNVRTGKQQGPFAIEYPGPRDSDWTSGGQILGSRGGRSFRVCTSGQTAFLATQEQTMAVRLWRQGEHVAHAHLWETNYEHSGHGSFTAPSVATGEYLFSVWPVLERGPHCPDARIELHVKDAATGKPLARLKPVLSNVVHTPPAPVIAGKYLFVTGPGGGSHGGHDTHSQIAVVTADDELQLIARNLVPMGSRAPVFLGEKMFLRSGSGLTCVAVTGKKGLAHQQQVLADTLLAEIGPRPVVGSPRRITPLDKPIQGPRVPVGKLIDSRATDKWLAAGPFKAAPDSAAIAALTPRAGETLRADGQARALGIVSREFASMDPPRFAAQYSLQGTGENVPVLSTHVDPQVVSGKDKGTGVLMTVLDNREQNVVVPALKANGVRQILAGKELRADAPLLLPPGQYPYAIVVGPEYYHVEQQKVYPPIDVFKAREKKLLNMDVWPESWKVLGPLPPESKPLTAKQLKTMPDKMNIGERTFPAYDLKPIDGTVYLTALLTMKQGQKPDPATAPKKMKIGTPSMAYAMAEIDAPSDGVLYVTAGADWFMRWTLDGEVVYDRLKSGNASPPTDIKAHPFAIPLKKGKHVLAVQVKPGSRGWSFSAIGGFAPRDTEDIKSCRVPTRIKPVEPDFRFAPCFKIVPHPMKREALWLKRVAARKDRLEAVIEGMAPDSPQARAASDTLRMLSEHAD